MYRYFAIQLDESTDARNYGILFCFVHYMGKEDFKEELLRCIKPGRSTGSETFRLLNNYFMRKRLCGELCRSVHR